MSQPHYGDRVPGGGSSPPMHRRPGQPPPVEVSYGSDVSAQIALNAAVTALCRPGRYRIIRADPIIDTAAAGMLAEDRNTEAALRAEYRRATDAGHSGAASRALAKLADHQRRVQERRAAIAAIAHTAHTPPLLEQLQAAVAASNNHGAGARAGPYRVPIDTAAADLLAAIEHAVGHRRGVGRPLTDDVVDWACGDYNLPARAQYAVRWVDGIRALVDPPKRWSLPGECTSCGHAAVHVPDDSGQHVRRDALEIDRDTGVVRCLHCRTRWETPSAQRILGRALVEQQLARQQPGGTRP